MHPLARREKAFDLYVRGASLREISNALKVSLSTVERWKARDDWETRDAQLGADMRRKLDRKRVKFKLDSYDKLAPIADEALGILKALTEKGTRFRTLEGGINAVTLLLLAQNKLLGISEPGTHIKIENKAQAANVAAFQYYNDKLFQILRRVFGPVFDMKKDEVIRAIQDVALAEQAKTQTGTQ